MDLNQKYSDHQRAMLDASVASDEILREMHLERAGIIAGEIAGFQNRMGAAAACAWNALRSSSALSEPRPAKELEA